MTKASATNLWFTLAAIEAGLIVIGTVALKATPASDMFHGTSLIPALALALLVLVGTVAYALVSIIIELIRPRHPANLKQYILKRVLLVGVVFAVVVGGGALFSYLLVMFT